MRVSYKWLSDYIDVNETTPEKLADKITLTGIEIEEIIKIAEQTQNIVVGEVLEATEVEGSDHLQQTLVSTGQNKSISIVCGAPNVAVGQKVIVALPGARLANGLNIKESQIKGIESNGMICSLQEIGFSENVIPKKYSKGIYVFPKEVKVGSKISEYLGLDDSILDLAITPNRADALSMRGVAYEVGAILDKKPQFEKVAVKESSDTIEKYVSVSVEEREAVPFYSMRIVKNLSVTESPIWLQNRLMLAGIRPLDLIVDVTNYIMLEYGQPLHAFDYDKINSKIVKVRRAEDSERIITLDETERTLTGQDLVITDGEHPIALAGVMGGFNSHITEETTTVALESALFNPALIRKTAQKMNLRSESSSRFEKGVNEATIIEALNKAANLIAELGNGEIVKGIVSLDDRSQKTNQVSITLSVINRSLGTDLTIDEVEEILNRLDFIHERSGEKLTVTVPSRRWDITIPADLLEEVARIYGYNNIPSTLPSGESIPGELTTGQQMVRHTQTFMEEQGFSQAITYALTTPSKAKDFTWINGETVSVQWPMSEERQTLRMNLISGLLETVQYNLSRRNTEVAFYEIGNIFVKGNEELPRQEKHLAGAVTGSLVAKNWTTQALEVNYYTVKGIVEKLIENLGIKAPVRFEVEETIQNLHPGQTARMNLDNQCIGFIGRVHPMKEKLHDLSQTFVFELNMDALIQSDKQETVFDTIPKYPGTSRDIALLVDEAVTHAQIEQVIKETGGEWLVGVRLFDLYQGNSIPEGKKSLAYTLDYLNPQATLVEEDVNNNFNKVKEELVQSLNVEVR